MNTFEAGHEPSPTARVERLRRRTTALFLSGVGLGSVGLTAAIIVSTLAAQQISGATTWSGLPSAMSILGTAAGTTLLAHAMQRLGRRNGLVCSYSLATLGAVAALTAVVAGSLPLLIAGMFTIGLGRSGDSLSRYLVADLYPVDRRASAIGWMVWMGTIAAVVGPNSLDPSGRLASQVGLPRLAGPYLVTLVSYGLVAILYAIFLRPDPSTLVYEEDREEESLARARLSDLFQQVNIRVALAVLVVGHVVMVLIMTMTPLNLKATGHGLGPIGLVMSSHIVGMFVLAPVAGRLVDRWGRLPVILVGQVTLLVAAVSALLAPAADVGLMALALFLLGLGWNLGFVAGSALLSSGLTVRLRARLQGVTDSLIWASAAIASASSGLVLSAFGYDALCLIGILLLVIPAAVILRHRKALPKVRSKGSVSHPC
jgi:MFS family permease